MIHLEHAVLSTAVLVKLRVQVSLYVLAGMHARVSASDPAKISGAHCRTHGAARRRLQRQSRSSAAAK